VFGKGGGCVGKAVGYVPLAEARKTDFRGRFLEKPRAGRQRRKQASGAGRPAVLFSAPRILRPRFLSPQTALGRPQAGAGALGARPFKGADGWDSYFRFPGPTISAGGALIGGDRTFAKLFPKNRRRCRRWRGKKFAGISSNEKSSRNQEQTIVDVELPKGRKKEWLGRRILHGNVSDVIGRWNRFCSARNDHLRTFMANGGPGKRCSFEVGGAPHPAHRTSASVKQKP